MLAIEPEKLLQYSYWSEMSRLPDTPQNRTVLTFVLESTGGKTRLTFRQENFHYEDEYKHANFFWNVVLFMMKKQIETQSC